MSWRIFRKTEKDILRTKCELCGETFNNGDKILEVKESGYNISVTNRFHLICIEDKGEEL